MTRHKSANTHETYYDKLGLDDAEDSMGQLPGPGSAGSGSTEPTDGSDQQERIRE